MKICLDIGGWSIESGLISGKKIIKKFETNTNAQKGQKTVLANIVKAIEAVYDSKASSINVGIPGPADYGKGLIGNSPNLPLSHFNVKAFLTSKFSKPVKMDNDASCFALGEAVYGAGKNYDVALGLTLGTGIGGGLVLGKKLYRGRGNATEFGHILMGDRDWEHSFQKLKKKGKITNYKKFGQLLGKGIVSLMHAIDPDIVVIGGGISADFPRFRGEMEKTIRKYALFRPCPVVRSRLKHAALLGANLL